MRNRLITHEGLELELEDRELEETSGPAQRMREVLEEFEGVQELGRRRWFSSSEGFHVIDTERHRESAWSQELRPKRHGPERLSPEWWRQRYARLKADTARYAKEHRQKLAWQKRKYRENLVYRERRKADGLRRARAWYARIRKSPELRQQFREKARVRARKRYQRIKADPAQRERYERLLVVARETARRRSLARKETP